MNNKFSRKAAIKSLFYGLFGFSTALSTCISAEPLTLSNVPLQATGKAEPNLMILVDNSGSMDTALSDGRTRMEVAKEAAVSVVNGLNNMRVGLAGFHDQNSNNTQFDSEGDDDGAKILKGLTSLSATGARDDIVGKINGLQPTTWTPLAESLATIGRYFAEGHDTAQLTIHPGQANETTAIAKNFLGPQPQYGFGASIPSTVNPAIQYYCQKNFALVLTDGLPTMDVDIAANQYLQDYDGDCSAAGANCGPYDRKPNQFYEQSDGSDYLDDVAMALQDVDLRPDLDDPNDNAHKNNITSYFIGFADGNLANNPVLADAGRQGGGDYKYASNATELAAAFNEALDSISNSIGTQASVSFNSTSLDEGSVIYSAKFDTSDFSGRLYARSMNPETGKIAETLWEASEKLANESSNSRKIVTYLDGEGVPFTVPDLDDGSGNNSHTITVYAWAKDGTENLALKVGGTTEMTWTLSQGWGTYSATTTNVDGAIEVEFTNDNTNIRDVVVDYILIDGGTRQEAETQGTNTGSYGSQGCGSDPYSGDLDCNGSITFCSIASCGLATVTPHRADLRVSANTGSIDDQWRDRLAYLRGDTSKDTLDGFRPRGTFTGGVSGRKLLGDIVHSTPIYVGEPELNWPAEFGTATKSYAQFKIDNENRTPLVYVGANDGMLHGFNAETGEEMFAYVPSAVLSAERYEGLHVFTSSVYPHRYYVDLTPSASDVFIEPKGQNQSEWRTVLIGGLRGGGKGYFALDVTNPATLADAENNADNIVLWEFDGGDNVDRANLGYSYSETQVAKLNNGKWAVIFGNGYNSTNGVAGLFIVYIEEGMDGWSAGDWRFISTGAGTVDNRKNGLSAPTLIDLNGDSVVDRVYAGDLMGNMWAFDLCNADADGACAATDTNWDVVGDKPLFKAPQSNQSAIMAAPLVARNTVVTDGAAPNVLVMFGTGQYLNQGDLTDDNAGAFYAVWDNGHTVSNSSLGESDLFERVLETDNTGRKISSATTGSIDWTSYHGWRMGLTSGSGDYAGERVITAAQLRRNTLLFSTIIPNPSPCASSGTGYQMSFDFRTGEPEVGLKKPVTDFNNDGQIDGDDEGYVGKLFEPPVCTGVDCEDDGNNGSGDPGMPGKPGLIGDRRCTPGSNGEVYCDDLDPGDEEREGRLSWEELTPG